MVKTHLRLFKHGAVAVEELVRGYQLGLDQAAGQDGRRCPPSCADGHLPKPRLERETPFAAHYLVHGCGEYVLCRGCEIVGGCWYPSLGALPQCDLNPVGLGGWRDRNGNRGPRFAVNVGALCLREAGASQPT